MPGRATSLPDAPRMLINGGAQIRRESIADGQDCIIVDDFLLNPEDLVDFACRHIGEFTIPPRSYPGMVRDIDDRAMTDVYRFFRSTMSRPFGFFRGGTDMSTQLSLTSLPPDTLSNLQRLCHSDPAAGIGRANYAGLIYLFRDEKLGGTGFYRWKNRPLMERVTELEMTDPASALRLLQEHFETFRHPARYITQSNEIAELVHRIPARFNRLIFYSGDMPHSAYIENPDRLHEDPARGRLTLNCFASVKPSGVRLAGS